jgi:hypothetical protein
MGFGFAHSCPSPLLLILSLSLPSEEQALSPSSLFQPRSTEDDTVGIRHGALSALGYEGEGNSVSFFRTSCLLRMSSR